MQPFGLATLGSAGLVIIPLMVGVSIFGSATSTLLSTSRITFVAARDGFLPRVLSGLHVTQKTPLPAILIHVSFLGMRADMRFLCNNTVHVTTDCSVAVLIVSH